jgi:hypothetical protein
LLLEADCDMLREAGRGRSLKVEENHNHQLRLAVEDMMEQCGCQNAVCSAGDNCCSLLEAGVVAVAERAVELEVV